VTNTTIFNIFTFITAYQQCGLTCLSSDDNWQCILLVQKRKVRINS